VSEVLRDRADNSPVVVWFQSQRVALPSAGRSAPVRRFARSTVQVCASVGMLRATADVRSPVMTSEALDVPGAYGRYFQPFDIAARS